MARVDLRALTQPVGIMRIVASVLTCLLIGLAGSAGYRDSSYWAWCMFTWCFCFFFTFLILIMEFSTVSSKLPFHWEDFTSAFAILGSLMVFSASIIYPIFFTCSTCDRQIGASVVSWLCFALYAGEVVWTRLRPSGEHIGFLATLPGIMKILETFLACIIFTSLEAEQYSSFPELQWCVAVFSLCFIFNIIIILLTIGQVTSYIPIPFDKVVIVYNVLAAVMYATAMVIWPLFSFRTKKPPNCGRLCPWNKLVVVTIMTIFNFIIYTLDCVYAFRLVFCVRQQ